MHELFFKHALFGDVTNAQQHIAVPAVVSLYRVYKNALQSIGFHKALAFEHQVFAVLQRDRDLAAFTGRGFFPQNLMAG